MQPQTSWHRATQRCPVWAYQGTGSGATLDRRAGESKPDTPRKAHCEANAQTRFAEDCCGLIDDLTEDLRGVRCGDANVVDSVDPEVGHSLGFGRLAAVQKCPTFR